MPDLEIIGLEKTYEAFERVGYTDHIKKDPPAWKMQLDNYRNWKARVIEPSTKQPRKNPEHPELEYPIKTVTVIKRVMTSKGEHLLSNQRWIGRTSMQNNLPINMDSVELWDEPSFEKHHKLNPKDASDVISEIAGIDAWIRHYTLPNTPDNLQILMNMADPNQPPGFVVADFRMTGSSPREVLTFEELRDKKFDELLNPAALTQQQPNSAPGTARIQRPKA